MVELVGIITNNLDTTKYSINFLRGDTMIVTEEFLKSKNVTDIGYILQFNQSII